MIERNRRCRGVAQGAHRSCPPKSKGGPEPGAEKTPEAARTASWAGAPPALLTCRFG